MRVLILGSMKDSKSESEFESFRTACRDIGRALASSDHTLVLGSDGVHTADRYVMEGFASVRASGDVVVHYPEAVEAESDPNENAIPFIRDSGPVYPKLKIRYKRDTGSWTVAHTAGIHSADVAIMICGRRRCDLVGHLAPVLGKPILAIPLFGGTAHKAWPEFSSLYRSAGITDDELADISIKWSTKSGATVANAAEKLFRKNPLNKQSKVAAIGLCSMTILALAAWITIFVLANRQAVGLNWSFFILLALSAFMGTGLRVTTALARDPSYRFETFRVYAELTTGLVLSFGFMLFFFVGALVFTGNMKQLTNLDDFSRTAISLSAIGLATAFLLERAGEALSSRLRAAIFERQK